MQGSGKGLLVGKDHDRAQIGDGKTALDLALDAYQKESARFARFPDKRTGSIVFFGIVGEACEVIGSLLEHPWRKADTVAELGDVLWYVAAICDDLGVSMSSLDRWSDEVAAVIGSAGTTFKLIRANYLVVHAGRIAEAQKKALRDDGGALTLARRQAVVRELGNVVAFVRWTAESCGMSLEGVIAENVTKLHRRKANGSSNGNG